ncbi:uncharacterized protein LOC115759359 [Drosophila novamexicana]|uniref:uncharacterized protein LOC115759359 n=1 Tax=Drosophila novamexicana TaxID=47314 RepID=UPI0011E5CF6A|nr:uncharacterized protein LOC115759359 [Drosophila novamexicana]
MIGEFSKVLCEIQDPKIMETFNCQIKQTSKNLSGIYAKFKLLQDVTNVNGFYSLAIKHVNKFINYTAQEMNYCEALHMVHKQYLTQMVAVGLRRVSNFPLDCSFKKDSVYYVNGFTIDEKFIPAYMPKFTFKADGTFFFNNRQYATITIFGSVVRK